MTTDTCSTSIPACGELDTSEHGRQKSPLPGQAHPHPAQAEGRVWDRPGGRTQREGTGPSRCWPNSGISQRASAGSQDLEKELTPHWGQEEQAPSSATSQHSWLLWTVS